MLYSSQFAMSPWTNEWWIYQIFLSFIFLQIFVTYVQNPHATQTVDFYNVQNGEI